MIVVTNPERVASFKGFSGMVTAGQDIILELSSPAKGPKLPRKQPARRLPQRRF